MDREIIDEIVAIVGRENVFASEEERKCYSYDGTVDGAVPDLIVYLDYKIREGERIRIERKQLSFW